MRKNDYVIIMAGGIGSRFWPMSRSNFPKQFHDILGLDQSMIQMAYHRVNSFIPSENILIVTNERYGPMVREQLPELRPQEILLEPVGRNTAPCIAYAVFKIRERNPDASVLVMGADYLIQDAAAFQKDAELAMEVAASQGHILTLGIRPTHPNTGYGYIQYDEDQGDENQGYFKVRTFTEKPDLEMARQFLESGEFLWNSGMFIFSLPTILQAFQDHLPDMYDIFRKLASKLDTEEEGAAIAEAYSMVQNISVDNGIMEQETDSIYVIPAGFDWDDLGTWGSVYTHLEKDFHGNASQGELMLFESHNNMVRIADEKKLVVLQGMDDFIVVDTGDVLMVCRKDKEQEIKAVVKEVKRKYGDDFA